MAKRQQRQAFAIVRVEVLDDETIELGHRITVKRILRDQSEAEAEVERLNELNGAKGCRYFWQCTRVDEDVGAE